MAVQGGGTEQLTYPQHRERSERGAVPVQLLAGYKSLLCSPLGQESRHPLVLELVPARRGDRKAWALHLWQLACWASAVPKPPMDGQRWKGSWSSLLQLQPERFKSKTELSLSKTEFLLRPLPSFPRCCSSLGSGDLLGLHFLLLLMWLRCPKNPFPLSICS